MVKKSLHAQIGCKIRQWRKASHMSQSVLADLIGVHRNSIHNWEVGKRAISSTDLIEIAQILRFSVSRLTEDEAPPKIHVCGDSYELQ
jgi:DNA-binding XRE family transcriptional regulator